MAGKRKKNTYVDCKAFFENGRLIGVDPIGVRAGESLYELRDIAYQATEIVSDGVSYSLLDTAEIRKIAIPSFSEFQDVVFSFDYILRMCASHLRDEKMNELSIEVLKQALKIMPHSNIAWSIPDYLRLPIWLFQDGRIAEGKDVEAEIMNSPVLQDKCDIRTIAVRNLHSIIADGWDLISFSSYGGAMCSECAVLSGRVYSVSGRDKRFPKLPATILSNGGYHPGCDTGILRYWKGDKIYHRGEYVDALLSTNRPYIDDRTDADKRLYQQIIDNINKKNSEYGKYREYLILRAVFPDLMPKSQYKYACEKEADSELYRRITDAANKCGCLDYVKNR